MLIYQLFVNFTDFRFDNLISTPRVAYIIFHRFIFKPFIRFGGFRFVFPLAKTNTL